MDLSKEHVISLAAAAQMLPTNRQGKHPSEKSVWRWLQHGVRSWSGNLVKLEGVRTASNWATTSEAVARFLERLTPPPSDSPSYLTTRAGKRRGRPCKAVAAAVAGAA